MEQKRRRKIVTRMAEQPKTTATERSHLSKQSHSTTGTRRTKGIKNLGFKR